MYFLQKLAIFMALITLIRAEAMNVSDIIEMIQPYGDGCENVPERVHVKEVILNVKDAQELSKCFRHCLMEQFDLIDETNPNLMNEKQAMELFGMMYDGKEEEMKKIIKDCNEKNANITPKCENAHSHGMCIFESLKEQGFDMPEIIENE